MPPRGEIRADRRRSRAARSRDDPSRIRKGVVQFELTVRETEFTGTANDTFQALDGTVTDGLLPARLTGRRFDPFSH
ncbi:hypothetical protein [Nocardia xishanensis]|uniref:hypothetical protein n=1 Tax=Nocardia xishanensis TaxID=238964 RepID=UPI0012F51FBE|nr:hypothetical protein [Nocardia xishanensis]